MAQVVGERAVPDETGGAICERCRQVCLRRYRSDDGRMLCGFCTGVGPDDQYTGKPGRLPEGWATDRSSSGE